ncbi:MAG: transposase, partial [Planctomycetes bacterium]|nr:transposase [Planctomycetota bacterium]
VYICNECGLKIDRDYNASLNLLTELKKQIGKVLAEFTSADLKAMQSDLVINQIVTSKVETEIQQKSYL